MIFLFAFLWGWSEATFFFIVPDFLLTLLALRAPRVALTACLWATLGAVVGGAMTYDYATLHPASSREILVMIPGISDRMIGDAGNQLEEHGAAAVFIGPLRGIPYKIYAVQAAWQRRPLVEFLLVSIPARAIRFLLTTLLASAIASRLRLRERTLVHIHLLAWTAFYTAYFAMHGHL